MARTERGQAAVESVGVTVTIALLVAVLAVWTAGNIRPSAAPPDVIGHVADPLGFTARRVEQAWSRDDLPPWLDTGARGRGDRPIGRFIGRVGEGARGAVGLGIAFDEGWQSGIQPVVRRRMREFLRDPVGSASSVDLADTAIGLIQRSGRLPDYIRMLRAMPPREAARRLGHDLGATTGDVGFDILQTVVAKRAGGALGGRRTGGAGPPGP
ncbi:MAG TPA: hypothetical protein PKD59_01190 [Miltoncostaeaceae bacterium]|mgnify:CR=1 FL=1|nr:hypothetical protein [Miltoncostaeaceae bacterium]